MRDLLVNHWDLEPPRVLVSVTGGASGLHLPPQLDSMVRSGLARVAASKSVWFIDGGMNSGWLRMVAPVASATDRRHCLTRGATF